MRQMSFADLSKKDIEGPYKLPESWRWVRLGDVTKINPSKKEIKEISDDTEVSFVPMNAVDDKKGKIVSPEIRKLKNVRKGYTYFKENDVIFAKITPCMENGKCAIAKNLTNGLGFGSTEFHVIRALNNISSKWVYFYLRQRSTRDEAVKYFTGSVGQQRVPKEFLENLLIPLPPLPEQKRIVARIEELFSKIDEIRRLKRQALEQTKVLMSVVLHDVFSKAGEKGWRWVRLGKEVETDGKKYKLIAIESGRRPKGGSVEQGIPSLGGEQLLSNGRVNWNKLRFIPEDFYESMQKGKVKEGDVLVVKDGATTGKTVYVDHLPYRKIAVNEHVFLLRSKTEVLENKYLFYMLFSDVGQDQIKRLFHGATQGGITQNDVKSIQVPLPPLPEQKQIVAYLDKIQEKVIALQKFQEETEKEVEELRESILNKAFRGKL